MRINFKGFIDTTLRDGQSSPLLYDTYKYRFSLAEKKQIVNALLKLGVRFFEFYSPVVSEEERKSFLILKKYIKSLTPEKTYLLAHCRCHPLDIQTALGLGFDGLNLYMGLSEEAQENYGKSLRQLSDLIGEIVISTRQKNPLLWLRYSGEDAFRTSLKNLFLVYDRIAQYVDAFGFPDTTGTATPEKVGQRVRAFKKRYPKVNLECHFHNDRGLSLINTMAAVKNGAEFIDSSIWGMAERSGITSVTGALLNFYEIDKSLVKNFNLQFAYPLNVLMASILGWQVPWTEPVSLTNRTHIAGVHQKAVLGHKGYEAHQLEKFGITSQQLLLGPLSGWNFIYYFLKEMENYIITPEEAKIITADFKKQTKKLGKKIKPEEILNQLGKSHSLTRTSIPKKFADKRKENLGI